MRYQKVNMKSQRGSATVILLAILVVVLAAVLVYFAFLKKPGEVAISPTPTPTKTASPTATVDPTADWKTATNRFSTNSGYSIKYPNGWNAETSSGTTTLTNFSNSDQVISIEFDGTGAKPGQLSLNQWLELQRWPNPEPIEKQFKPIAAIGGVSAVEQSQTGTVYFVKDATVFVVNNGIGFERKVVDEKLFLQVLSTFKFTK